MEPEWNRQNLKALKKINVLLIKYWGIGAEKKISETEILFFFQKISQVFKFFHVKTVPVNFVVDTVESYYCNYYEIYWNSLYFFFVGEYEF